MICLSRVYALAVLTSDVLAGKMSASSSPLEAVIGALTLNGRALS